MIRDVNQEETIMLLNAVVDRLREQDRKLNDIMATQAELDAATAALTTLGTNVAGNVAQLQTDVAAIQALLAAPQLDTTALDAAVASVANTASSLDASVSSVTALVPAAPAA
jgi:hypothetical protein